MIRCRRRLRGGAPDQQPENDGSANSRFGGDCDDFAKLSRPRSRYDPYAPWRICLSTFQFARFFKRVLQPAPVGSASLERARSPDCGKLERCVPFPVR
jgi:hypothetical protein